MTQKLNNTPSKIYLSSAWQQHADLVSHLSQFSQNVLLIIAPHRGGKTTFLRHISEMPLPGIKRIIIDASSQDTVDSFMEKIALAFDCAWEGMDALLEHVSHYVDEASLVEMSVSLMVDDAHLLNHEQMEKLVQLFLLNTKSQKQLRLVLLGEPSLESRLSSPEWDAFFQGKMYTIELESWTLDDIRAFWSQDPLAPRLNDQKLIDLFQASGGLPGNVVREKDPLLEHSQMVRKKTGKSRLRRWEAHPVSLGILIGGLMGGGYLIFSGVAESDNGTVNVNFAHISEDVWDNEPQQRPLAPPPQLVEQSPLLLEQEAVPSVAQQEVLPIPEEELVSEYEEKETPTKTIVAEMPDRKAGLTEAEERLLSLKGEHYTLQLIGSTTEDKVKEFVNAHGIHKQAYSYKTKLSGRDWYVVVYGDYPSKMAAKEAIAAIPDSLKKENLRPWVREVESIHEELRSRQA